LSIARGFAIHEQHLHVERHRQIFLSKNHSTAHCCLTTRLPNVSHLLALSGPSCHGPSIQSSFSHFVDTMTSATPDHSST
jgi:hypothetical protein